MGIGDRIKKRRLELGMSQQELAEEMGYTSKSTINKIELGKNDVTQSKVVKFAKILKTTPAYLMDWDSDNDFIYTSANIDFVRVPLYDSICCGNGGFVDDNIIEMVAVPSKGLNPHLEYFAQYATGESMEGAGIDEGDLLVFERCDKVDNGVIGCFCVGEEAMCKKYKELEQIIMLAPMNVNFEPIVIDPLNNNVRCIGRLKKVIKDFE